MSEAQRTEAQEEKEYSNAFAQEAGKKESTGSGEQLQVDEERGRIEEQAASPDPYEGMTLEQRQYFEGIEHRARSDGGRISAYQRQIDALNQQLQAAVNSVAPDDSDTPSQADINAAMQSEEGWDDFKEEYPEIAAAFDSRMNSVIQNNNRAIEENIGRRIAPAEQLAAESAFASNNQFLDEIHEGWSNRVATPEFDEWIETQHDVVQGWVTSDAVDDAASLITAFDNHLKANGLWDRVSGGSSVPGGSVQSNAGGLEKRRRQQLEDGETFRSTGAGVHATDAPGGGGEFSSYFAMEANKRERQRTRTG